jgi:hypothetical protein
MLRRPRVCEDQAYLCLQDVTCFTRPVNCINHVHVRPVNFCDRKRE